MSDNAEKLDDLKNILTSLVVPHPHGLSLRILCKEYEELEGEPIPYRELGFRSLTQLLSSMRDKMRLEGDLSQTFTVTVFPVRTDENKHVIDLVRGQNKSRKKRGRGGGRPSFYPTRPFAFSNYHNVHNYARVPVRASTPAQRPLSRSYTGLSASNISECPPQPSNAYESQSLQVMQSRFYYDLWWAYYNYYDAMSQTFPHLVQRQMESYTTQVRPPLLPNCVPTPQPQRTTPFFAPTSGYTPRQTTNITAKIDPQDLEKFKNFTITRNVSANSQQPSSQSAQPSAQTKPSRSASDLNSIVINNMPSRLDTTIASKPQCLPSEVKDNIRQMMSSEDVSDGIMLFNFTARYKHQFKEVLDFQKYGFQTLADCLKSIPDVLEMIQVGTTYKLLLNKTPQEPKATEPEPTATPQSPLTNGQMTSTDTIGQYLSPEVKTLLSTTTSPNTSTKIKTRPMLFKTLSRSKNSTNTSTTSSTTSSSNTSTNTITTTTCAAADTHTTLTNGFTLKPSGGEPSVKPMVNTTPIAHLASKKTTTIIATPNTSLVENGVQEPSRPPLYIPPSISPIEAKDDTESVRSVESIMCPNPIARHNFRRVLMTQENGIKAIDFPAEYQRMCNVSFDSRIWGFRTPMELFVGLPSIFTVVVNENNEPILHDARFKKAEKIKINNDPTKVYRLMDLSDKVKARIIRLVKMCGSSGLAIEGFVRMYSLNYESIDLTSLKVPDANYLFEALKHDIPIRLAEVNGVKRAFITSDDELCRWVVRQTRQRRFVVPNIVCETPPNVVLTGEEYRPTILPEKFEAGNYEYVAVYISSAVNPQEIYVQFKGEEYHTALEDLMHKLDFYETAPEAEWTVPFEFLYVGYPVICRYPGDRNWHRGKIVKVHSYNEKVVTVSFVDYGGTTVLQYTALRLMKQEFFQLPIQALKVGLFGIKPTAGNKISDWTIAARNKVLEFSRPRYPLACTLMKVQNGTYWVALCDTNSNTDIFLHAALVEENLALMKTDEEIQEEERPSDEQCSVAAGDHTNGH